MIKNPALVLFISYPLLAYLSCHFGGYLWHRQLEEQQKFGWLTGDGVFDIYLSYYSAVVFNTLGTLFYDVRLLRFFSFVGTTLLAITVSKGQSMSSFPLPAILSFLLVFYPDSTKATTSDQKKLIQRFFMCVGLLVVICKFLEAKNYSSIFHLYKYVDLVQALEVYPGILIPLLSKLTFLVCALELILVLNLLGAMFFLFQEKTKKMSLALMVITIMLSARLGGWVEVYWAFLILVMAVLAVYGSEGSQSQRKV